MLAAGGVQFVVGCVLEGKQSIVGTGYGQEDLTEFVLGRPLMAALRVLDDEDHGQGHGGYHGLEDHFPSSRKSCHDAHDDPGPGRDDDEDRSQEPRREPVSHRLTRGLDNPRAGDSAMEPGNRCQFSPSLRASSSRPIFDLPGSSRLRAIS
jgi:hypothetical protein